MRPGLRHSLRNLVHSAVLILGMAGVGWVCAVSVWGSEAALWVLGGVGLFLVLSPALPKDLVLSLYDARELRRAEFPDGIAIVDWLADRAGLEHVPRLYYLPSSLPNAFAVGSRGDAAIAVSDGLLRLLDLRELTAVLAHEVGHVANRDLWIMGLADVMARVTTVSSFVGQFLLILNLPLILVGAAHVPWTAPIVLALSPTVMSLLQLALSRAREFEADRTAAQLTGDPEGLISALRRLERSTGRFWEEILMPGRRIPDPSLLRTHPKTEDRVARLRDLATPSPAPRERRAPEPPRGAVAIPIRHIPVVVARPRWRRTGVWY